MVTFYQGNTLEGITRRILQSIDPTERGNHVVLVPDRNTLSREETVVEALGGSLVNVEILTFARLAVRVLGRAAAQCLTPEACTVLLAKALLQCRDDLVYYRHSVDTDGFANEMYSSLVAVRNSGVDPDDLMAAADRMQGRMADKTRDMAVIYNAYLAQLAARLDPTTRLQMLCKALPDSPYIADSHFYVIDFFAFNPMQYRVLYGLMQYADVHIGYIADAVGQANRRVYPHALRDNLRALAAKAGVRVEGPIDCTTVLPPYKQYMQDALFGYAPPFAYAQQQGRRAIRLFYQTDATAEIRTVCAEIRALLRQNGYRYRDFAIVCADLASYWDVMYNVFGEYGIPFFADRRTLLSQVPVCQLLLDMAQCVRRNCEFDMVMRVVKNPLFGVDMDDVHTFENYCRRYGVKYTLFLRDFVLGDEQERVVPQRVRARFAALLPDFEGCATVADYIRVIRGWLQALDIDAVHTDYYLQQRRYHFVDEAAISAQVPRRLADLLSMMQGLVGDTACDLDLFLRLLQSALSSVKIALLPQSADCVYIGDALDSRYDKVKVMFVVGAQQGKLPQDPVAGSILSDVYVGTLAAQNVQLHPTNREQFMGARFYLLQLLLTPSDALYVSYTTRGFDAKPQYASSLVDALATAFALPVKCGLQHDLARQIGTVGNAYRVLLRTQNHLASATKQAVMAILPPQDKARYEAIRPDAVSGLGNASSLFFRRELTSISQLENYFECPYRHFVSYGLRAAERDEADANSAETGTMLHRVMELFFSRHTDRLADYTQQQIDNYIVQCVDEAFAESRFASDPNRLLEYNRLLGESRIVLALEIRQVMRSQFKPIAFEAQFGYPPYPAIDLGSVRLRGKIDRIDRCGNLVRVIDYKSGKVDYYEFKYVYYGVKVQLYAYLAALGRQQGNVPAGGFYKRLSGDYKRESDKMNIGWLLGQFATDKKEWLNLMDPALATDGYSDLLPITVDKNGEYVTKAQMGVTYAQMCDMMDYVDALMRRAVDEIAQGNIRPSPIDDACRYCAAYAMCPYGRNTPQREMRTATPASFALRGTQTEAADPIMDGEDSL